MSSRPGDLPGPDTSHLELRVPQRRDGALRDLEPVCGLFVRRGPVPVSFGCLGQVWPLLQDRAGPAPRQLLAGADVRDLVEEEAGEFLEFQGRLGLRPGSIDCS